MKGSPMKETITLNLMGDNTYSIKMNDSQTDQLKIRSGTAEAKPVFNKISHKPKVDQIPEIPKIQSLDENSFMKGKKSICNVLGGT